MNFLDELNRWIAPLRRRIFSMIARGVVQAVTEDKALQRFQTTFLADETYDKIENMAHYGFISSPLKGAEALAVFLGGERSHGVVVATEDRRYRLKTLAPGEVALYTDQGDQIIFKRGNKIEITAGVEVKVTAPTVKVIASTKLEVTSPLSTFSGNVTIGGTLGVTGATTLSSTLAVTAAATFASTIAVTGTSTLGVVVAGAIAAAACVASGVVSAAGVSIATLKAVYNGHTHAENGTGGGVTNAPNQLVP